jgi:hypothetical protein
MTQYSIHDSPSPTHWIVGAVKRNPEGLLLLAAGCALLMRGGARSNNHRAHSDGWHGASGQSAERLSSMGERVAEAGRNAGEYVSDVAERLGEAAGSYASAVSDYADEAMKAVSERSRDFARQAQSSSENTAEYVLENQPLAIAVIGLAAGAAAAAAFPATKVERHTLGPTGEQLRDAAGEVSQRIKKAGAKAGERLMNIAEERGLTAEGLKEVARDVGETFGAAISGESSGKGQPGDRQNAQAGEPSRTGQGAQGQAASSRPSAGGAKRA